MLDPEKLITMDVSAAVTVNAPRERTFTAFVERIGEWLLGYPSADSLGLVLEPFGGGRLYRDLPGGASIWWATVQIYRPSSRIDMTGPLFVEGPSVSHMRFDFADEPAGTRVSVHHRTIGDTPAHPELVQTVWSWHLDELARMMGGV